MRDPWRDTIEDVSVDKVHAVLPGVVLARIRFGAGVRLREQRLGWYGIVVNWKNWEFKVPAGARLWCLIFGRSARRLPELTPAELVGIAKRSPHGRRYWRLVSKLG